MCRSKGSILIVSVWMLVILSMLALGFAARVKMGLNITESVHNKIKGVYLARSGVNAALASLTEQTTSYKTVVIDDITLGDGSVSIELVDEESKININSASYDILCRVEGLNEQIASAIIDWRDGDNLTYKDGAETAYYSGLTEPYACKNAPFETIEELLLVRGVTNEILDKISQNITVYGEGKVNINTCSGEVLNALGVDAALSEKILNYRNGADGKQRTSDDVVFENLSNMKESLGLSNEEFLQLQKLAESVSFNSKNYRAGMTVAFKRMIQKYNVVFNIDSRRILFWSDN